METVESSIPPVSGHSERDVRAVTLLVLLVAVFPMPAAAILLTLGAAGFLSGLIRPSRDMMVRAACPPGAAGRVFGIVATGFNIGGAIGPLLFGYFMDHGRPMWVFGITAAFMGASALAAAVGEARSDGRRGN